MHNQNNTGSVKKSLCTCARG